MELLGNEELQVPQLSAADAAPPLLQENWIQKLRRYYSPLEFQQVLEVEKNLFILYV